MNDATYPWRRPSYSAASGDADASDFGFAIACLRERCGWSRADVVERAGSMAYSTIAGIENGHRPPSTRTLGPLARGLGVDRDHLEGFWQLIVSLAPDDSLDSAWRALLAEAKAGTRHSGPTGARMMGSSVAFNSSRGPTPARRAAPMGGPSGPRLPAMGSGPYLARWSGHAGSDPFGDEIDDGIERGHMDHLAEPLMISLEAEDERELSHVAALEAELAPESQREALVSELHLLASDLPEDELATAVQVLRGLVAKAREEGALGED